MARPIAAGILSFTELERAQHHDFNLWHRYAHMPEEFLVESVVAGERLVAPPELQARRSGSDPALLATQYFGYYFVTAPARQSFQEMEDFGILHRSGGGLLADPRRPTDFGRKGPSATFELVSAYSAPDVVSAPAVMPFRPHQGVFVTVADAVPGAPSDELDESRRRDESTVVPEVMGLPGVAGCWSFESADLMDIPNNAPAPPRRLIRIYWLAGDPARFLDAAEGRLRPDDPEFRSLSFTGAFRVIEPDSAFEWFDAD
jgi:hypothetical protein